MVRKLWISWLCILSVHTLFVIVQMSKSRDCFQMTYYLPLLLVAVQNERQPRNTAHVSLDSICLDTRKEHLATTRELTSSATYSSVICRPLVTSSVTSSATTQPCSNPSNNHRFMVSLLTAETCAKLEPENGEITGQNLNEPIGPNNLQWDKCFWKYFVWFVCATTIGGNGVCL